MNTDYEADGQTIFLDENETDSVESEVSQLKMKLLKMTCFYGQNLMCVDKEIELCKC